MSDPIREGLARGWKAIDAAAMDSPLVLGAWPQDGIRDGARAVVRTDGSAPEHRAVGNRPQREQRLPAPWLREAGHPLGSDPAQREGLRKPRLLRHGLPAQRE